MAEFTITIPEKHLDRVRAALGKEGIPFEKRLQWAVRKATAQVEFDAFVEQSEKDRSLLVQAKNQELADEFNILGDD